MKSKLNTNLTKSDLEFMVGKNEQILWRSKPNKKCFILEGVFNPLLPFAFIWGLIDLLFMNTFIQVIPKSGPISFSLSAAIPIICFFFLHMAPVWIYLAGVVFIFRKYKHSEYIVTNKAVYISGGLFAYTCRMKQFHEFSRIDIHRGIIDQILNVGDILFTSSNDLPLSSGKEILEPFIISDVADYQKVFTLVKQLQTDIYTDTMFPNDLRPAENHGYKTKYKGLE